MLARGLAAAAVKCEKGPPLNHLVDNTAAFIHEMPADCTSNGTGAKRMGRKRRALPAEVAPRVAAGYAAWHEFARTPDVVFFPERHHGRPRRPLPGARSTWRPPWLAASEALVGPAVVVVGDGEAGHSAGHPILLRRPARVRRRRRPLPARGFPSCRSIPLVLMVRPTSRPAGARPIRSGVPRTTRRSTATARWFGGPREPPRGGGARPEPSAPWGIALASRCAPAARSTRPPG